MRILTMGMFATLLLSACGGNGSNDGNPRPLPQGSYDLQTAMDGLVKDGMTTAVNLSGTASVDGASNAFTGTGTLTLSPGVSGQFNETTALLQTESIFGTVSVDGQTAPYSSSVVNAYQSTTAAILGQSQTSEFDVAPSPIALPTTIGSTAVILGTLSRYSDSTLSVALGTVQVSVAVAAIPIDPGSPELVQFTYQVYDTSQTLVETDTVDYTLTEDSQLSLASAATQNAQGTLTLTTP